MNADITIYGLTPHTIGISILAKYYNLSTIIIDPYPLYQYPLLSFLENYERREPVYMDILTELEIPDLNMYKLSTFLNTNLNDVCNYKSFNAYLHFLLSHLKTSGYVKIIEDNISFISKGVVITNKGNVIKSRFNIIGINNTNRLEIPNEINDLNLPILNILTDNLNDISNKYIVVWGSSEEQIVYLLYLLANGNQIKWVIDKPFRISQYSLPSNKEWGHKNALSNYYFNDLKDTSLRNLYIKSVLEWQPSIYPSHKLLIDKYIKEGSLTILDKSFNTVSNIKKVINNCDYLVITPYKNIEVKDIPYQNKPVIDSYNSKFPLLNNNFTDSLGIYYVGVLASRLDGLRQLVCTSTGETANYILEDLRNVR